MNVRARCHRLLTSTAICLGPLGGAATPALALTQAQTVASAQDVPGTVSPQSTAAPTTTEGQVRSPAGIADIIVTAQKRAENVQSVPLSIQAFTGADLAARGVTDVSRIEVITPGLTFSTYGNDAKIALRGANANNTYQDASPVVGMFVDSVYQLRASQQTAAFFDVSRPRSAEGTAGNAIRP